MDDYFDRIQQVREAAAEGLTASQIAKRLGLSRQRIHQIIKMNKIEVRHAYDFPDTGTRLCIPPITVRAGYVTNAPVSVGAAAELIAAADLVARGWYVYMPVIRNRGHDIIAYKGDTIITLEVRCGKVGAVGEIVWRAATPKRRTPSHFAIVVIDQPVIYKPELPDMPPE